jgi:hypothetical protein
MAIEAGPLGRIVKAPEGFLADASKPQQVQTTGAKNKLVLQESDADAKKWNLALNNAKNVQQDLGEDDVDIEIVAYGPGIGMLKKASPRFAT